jgi:hypothetical protein
MAAPDRSLAGSPGSGGGSGATTEPLLTGVTSFLFVKPTKMIIETALKGESLATR